MSTVLCWSGSLSAGPGRAGKRVFVLPMSPAHRSVDTEGDVPISGRKDEGTVAGATRLQ